MVDISHSN